MWLISSFAFHLIGYIYIQGIWISIATLVLPNHWIASIVRGLGFLIIVPSHHRKFATAQGAGPDLLAAGDLVVELRLLDVGAFPQGTCCATMLGPDEDQLGLGSSQFLMSDQEKKQEFEPPSQISLLEHRFEKTVLRTTSQGQFSQTIWPWIPKASWSTAITSLLL